MWLIEGMLFKCHNLDIQVIDHIERVCYLLIKSRGSETIYYIIFYYKVYDCIPPDLVSD